MRTDAGAQRVLEPGYVAEHLQHAYALTAHTIQGGSVEWAGVVGHPEDFTRNWSYTALSRARQPTELFLVDTPTERQLDRTEVAPHQPAELGDERTPLERLAAAMRRRDDEDLALDRVDGAPARRSCSDRRRHRSAAPALRRRTAQRARRAARTHRHLPRPPRRPAPSRPHSACRGTTHRRRRAQARRRAPVVAQQADAPQDP